jgi:hypothetical protein
MRWARGFATGNARRAAGVNVEPEATALGARREGGVMDVPTLDGGWSTSGEVLGGRAGCEGNEVWGDGGGSTNEFGSNDAASGIGFTLNVGAGIGGSTSVSYEGTTLDGDGRERLETRVVLRPEAPALPTQTLAGDFRGDFFGEECAATPRLGDVRGCGVGGSSASIISTCHDRLSSKSFILSA